MRLFFRASRKNPPHYERHAGEERQKSPDFPPMPTGPSEGERGSYSSPRQRRSDSLPTPASRRMDSAGSRVNGPRGPRRETLKKAPGAPERIARSYAKRRFGKPRRDRPAARAGISERGPGAEPRRGGLARGPTPAPFAPPGGDQRKQHRNSLSAKRKTPPRQRPGASSSPSSSSPIPPGGDQRKQRRQQPVREAENASKATAGSLLPLPSPPSFPSPRRQRPGAIPVSASARGKNTASRRGLERGPPEAFRQAPAPAGAGNRTENRRPVPVFAATASPPRRRAIRLTRDNPSPAPLPVATPPR